MASSLLTSPDRLGRQVGGKIRTQTLLGATFMIAVAMATIGERGLPSPRRYAAIALLWFLFGLAAELGGQVARFTGALAALVTLAMAMGTGGRRALGWLTSTARSLQSVPAPAAPAPPAYRSTPTTPTRPRPGAPHQ